MWPKQCTMCTTINESNRKSCKHCKLRKYLKSCVAPEWRNSRNGSFYFFTGRPRDPYPDIELEYWDNIYHKGWCIMRNEEFTEHCNSKLGPKDVFAAQNWALRIIDENYGGYSEYGEDL